MVRYSRITDKNAREIVLLKARPCNWGRCAFCDYIQDNTENEQEILGVNTSVLGRVTGEFKSLEVINSGSVFELPTATLDDIKRVALRKDIQKLWFESHYSYRDRLDEIRSFFGREVVFKCGIETFDEHFRNHVLKKGIIFSTPDEVAKYFDSICLMVGIQGQTREMIDADMEMLKYFKYGCVNLYVNNTTHIKADEELQKWFKHKYGHMEGYPNIDVLWNNTDFGVG